MATEQETLRAHVGGWRGDACRRIYGETLRLLKVRDVHGAYGSGTIGTDVCLRSARDGAHFYLDKEAVSLLVAVFTSSEDTQQQSGWLSRGALAIAQARASEVIFRVVPGNRMPSRDHPDIYTLPVELISLANPAIFMFDSPAKPSFALDRRRITPTAIQDILWFHSMFPLSAQKISISGTAASTSAKTPPTPTVKPQTPAQTAAAQALERLRAEKAGLMSAVAERKTFQGQIDALFMGSGSGTTATKDKKKELDFKGCLTTRLYWHQDQAVRWMLERERSDPPCGILADEMGLGKSLDIIALVLADRAGPMGGRRAPTLIVCPVTLLATWREQIARHTKRGSVSVLEYHGSKKLRHDIEYDQLVATDIVLTTYGIVSTEWSTSSKSKSKSKTKTAAPSRDLASDTPMPDAAAGTGTEDKPGRHKRERESGLQQVRWRRVVLDEAHTIRNASTTQSKAACSLSADAYWCLTGTPIQNGIDDLYSLVKFMHIEALSDKRAWHRSITKPIGHSDVTAIASVRKLILGVCLRRTKDLVFAPSSSSSSSAAPGGSEVLSLPEKRIEMVLTEMTPDDRLAYDYIERVSRRQVEKFIASTSGGGSRPASKNKDKDKDIRSGESQTNSPTDKFDFSNALALLMRLRQACCSIHLLPPDVRKSILELAKRGSDVDIDPDVLRKLDERLRKAKTDANTDDCPVCMTPLQSDPNARITKCGHVFCSACLGQLFAHARRDAALLDEPLVVDVPASASSSSSSVGPAGPNATAAAAAAAAAPVAIEVDSESEADDNGAVEPDSDSGSDTDSDAAEVGRQTSEHATRFAAAAQPASCPLCREKIDSLEACAMVFADRDDDDTRTDRLSVEPDGSGGLSAGKDEKPTTDTKAVVTSGKIAALIKIISDARASVRIDDCPEETGGAKIVVFSQWTRHLDLVRAALEQGLGERCALLDGSMTAASREAVVREFRASDARSGPRTLLCSLRVGGVGLDLTAATHVVLLEPWWTPATEDQAMDRVHRLGQTRPVTIHRLIAAGSVEERMLVYQAYKKGLSLSAFGKQSPRELAALRLRTLNILFGKS